MNLPDGYEKYIDSVSGCSRDINNGCSLIDSQEQMVNFDRLVKDYARNLKIGCPASADGLFIDKNNCYILVEFKSGNVEAKNIQKKLYDSAIVLCDWNNNTIKWLRNAVKFVLVCPRVQPSDPNEAARRDLFEKGMKNSTKKLLKYIKSPVCGYLYKDALELTPDEFKKEFLNEP